MTDDDLTPEEIRSLVRDKLDQVMELLGMLVASESITAVLLHIDHALMHLEKEIRDGD